MEAVNVVLNVALALVPLSCILGGFRVVLGHFLQEPFGFYVDLIDEPFEVFEGINFNADVVLPEVLNSESDLFICDAHVARVIIFTFFPLQAPPQGLQQPVVLLLLDVDPLSL